MHLFKIVAAVWVVGTLSAWGGFIMGQRSAPQKPVDMTPMTKQLEELQEAVVNLNASRCMTVNTPVLQMSVYNVPNLGVHKVPKPTKKPVDVAQAAPIKVEQIPTPVVEEGRQ